MSSGRVARKAAPFTVEHFKVYSSVAILDSGEPFDIEPFQEEIAADVFAGYPEIWLVVPEGNGKTTFLALLGLYFGDYTPSAMIPIAASSREQAEIMYRQAEGLVTRSPELRPRFRAYDGYRRIKCHRTGGRLQVYAADDRTGDGIIPVGIALVDELHRHRDLKLYRTWRGKLEKTGAQIATISTAGEPDSEFEETRDRIKANADDVRRDGCHTRAASEDIVLHDFSIPDAAMADDMNVVAAANPRRAITAERLAKKFASPTMTRPHWLRFVCNVATAAEGCWLRNGAWEDCEEPGVEIPDGSPVWLGVDIGRKHDTTAIVTLWPRDDGKTVAQAHIMAPDGKANLDLAAVEQKIRDLADQFTVQGVSYDPWSFERSAQLLSDEGLLMIEHPMSNERMAKASSALYEAINTQAIVHNGDREFMAHVMAGHQKDTERGWRLAKNPHARRHIDALIALCLGFAVAQTAPVGGGFEW